MAHIGPIDYRVSRTLHFRHLWMASCATPDDPTSHLSESNGPHIIRGLCCCRSARLVLSILPSSLLQAVKGFKPIMSGIALFPETFTVAPSGVVVGLLINRTGQYYWAICIGWCLSTIGMGLLCLLGATTGTITWIFLNLVSGLGIGMVLPSVAIAVQASASAENLAIAVATSTSFRGFGQSIGVAIGGVIFQNRMKSNLLNYPALQSMASEYSGDAASAVELIKGMHGQVKRDLTQAYADSLKIVWAFCCGISGLIFIVSLFTKSYYKAAP